MDIRDLFLNCRSGDLKKIKYLVEEKDVDLNVRDRWDSTPLYYACLCGHGELVEYMLENGARCDAQTFDGERAIYGALTNEIRNKLKNFKVVTSRMVTRDDYEEFLRKMLDLGEYSDFTFHISNEIVPVHRFILAARSPYFYENFKTRWSSKKSTKLQNRLVDPSAFKTMIQYLYTGRLNTPIDEVEECIRLAIQCRLPDLQERLEEANKRLASFGRTNPGTKIKVLSLESAQIRVELQRDLKHLANLAIPPEFRKSHHCEMPALAHLVDVCFVVEHYTFYCHKAAFAVRSEYFRALFRDHFGETLHTDVVNDSAVELVSPPVVDVLSIRDITAEVFAQVVLYVYSNCVEISSDTVYELLNMGELYLLPGLKKLCANHLISLIDVENVVDLIRLARTYQLPRLETFCTEFIAKNLEEMCDQEEFHQLVMEDAAEVKGRQETDTIGIIDDVRYHVNFLYQDSSALTKHNLIEQLLESLNLEA